MFKVEENLILTKNAVLQDSFVVEDCGKYYEELSGFYVCLPKNRMDAIKQYMGTLNNSSFLLKIFDNNAVSGLSMLLQLEYKTSYTQEFVNYYGSVQGILESFAEAESDAVTNAEETDESDTSASQEEQFVGPAPSDAQPTDTFFEPTDLFVDESVDTAEQAIQNLLLEDLHQALLKLSPAERDFILSYYEMKIPNATCLAQRYGITRQAADKRLKKIEEKIKKLVAIF